MASNYPSYPHGYQSSEQQQIPQIQQIQQQQQRLFQLQPQQQQQQPLQQQGESSYLAAYPAAWTPSPYPQEYYRHTMSRKSLPTLVQAMAVVEPNFHTEEVTPMLWDPTQLQYQARQQQPVAPTDQEKGRSFSGHRRIPIEFLLNKDVSEERPKETMEPQPQQPQYQQSQYQQSQYQNQRYQKPQQTTGASPPMYHATMPVDISAPTYLASPFPPMQRLTPLWAMSGYPEQQPQQQQQRFPQMPLQQPFSMLMAQQHMAPVQTTFDYVMAPAPSPILGCDDPVQYGKSKPPYQDTIPSYCPPTSDIFLRQTSNDPISDRATSSNHESSLAGMEGRNESGANKPLDAQQQKQIVMVAPHPCRIGIRQTGNPNDGGSQEVNTELDISQSQDGRRSSRRRWTPEEDQIVLEAVRKNGPRHWDALAALLHGRNGQHVRLRYHNYLRFTLEDKEREFTPEEDQLILKSVASQNHRWSETAQLIGRSNNAVKNRYYLLVRHLKKTETEEALINESMANSMQRAASSGAGAAGASETQGSSAGDEEAVKKSS